MKRKITFSLTIGSQWPTKSPNDTYPVFPVGGVSEHIPLEFETDNINPMKDAFNALDSKMKIEKPDTTYHIWYWWWNN